MMKFYKILKSDFIAPCITREFTKSGDNIVKKLCFRNSFYAIKPTLNPEGWSYIRPNVGFCFLMHSSSDAQATLKTIFSNKQLAIKKVFYRYLPVAPLNHEF